LKENAAEKHVIKTYRDAGVDIERGENITSFIRGLKSPSVGRQIGAFSAGFEIDTSHYKNPVILSTTDGVGTKILVARELGRLDTIGIDLVAMCVNDLLASGALPLSFLDYIACGKIEENTIREIITGIVRGCEIAGCTLSGGETAELPDMYGEDDFDLAGFAVGIAEKNHLLPRLDSIHRGDQVFGLPSSGIHSNGLSLARKVIPPTMKEAREMLLIPTRIYSEEMKALLSTGKVLAAAHVTGGGIVSNLSRVIPKGLKPLLDFSWKIPEIFEIIRREGKIEIDEMYRVFNMGIGMCFVVSRKDKKSIVDFCHAREVDIVHMGELSDG